MNYNCVFPVGKKKDIVHLVKRQNVHSTLSFIKITYWADDLWGKLHQTFSDRLAEKGERYRKTKHVKFLLEISCEKNISIVRLSMKREKNKDFL
jgi:hypothetical protein